MAKKQVAVIGLGRFGISTTRTLYNLGHDVLAIDRDEEKVQTVSLGELNPAEVDMLTVVLVGSSQTRRLELPNREVKVYTPRGYDQKSRI